MLDTCKLILPHKTSGIDETAPETQEDAGTSQGQTHTTGEHGCSVPGPIQGLSIHLQLWDGEKYGVREKEHKRDAKTLEKYTRSRKEDSLMELHPSAITDHVAEENHTIDWEGVTFPC